MQARSEDDWSDFLERADKVLSAVAAREMSLAEASEHIENDPCALDEELREYFVNSIWEVDGFASSFAELAALVKERQGLEVFLRHILEP